MNWRLFTAKRSFIKPKSGCVTFTRVYTACLQYMQLRNIGKKQLKFTKLSIQTVTYCCFSCNNVSCLIKVPYNLQRKNLYQKSLRGLLTPSLCLNDTLLPKLARSAPVFHIFYLGHVCNDASVSMHSEPPERELGLPYSQNYTTAVNRPTDLIAGMTHTTSPQISCL